MEQVDPIRDIEQINAMRAILQQHSQRDLLLFVLGINTGLKLSELLALKVEDVWDGTDMKEFLQVKEEKSGEVKKYFLNNRIKTALESYLACREIESQDYLFKSKKNHQPITRQQAYRIIHNAAIEAGVSGNIGTTTLRKTFGYHAYRKGIAISILMSLFHHQSPAETFRYIGIDKNEKFPIKIDVNL